MTPEEHYAYGQALLRGCEKLMEVDPPSAHAQAGVAQGHFAAAAAGTGMRALGLLVEGEVQTPGDDPAPCGVEPCEHAPDGGNHPEVATDG